MAKLLLKDGELFQMLGRHLKGGGAWLHDPFEKAVQEKLSELRSSRLTDKEKARALIAFLCKI
jgi:hypothetical protein